MQWKHPEHLTRELGLGISLTGREPAFAEAFSSSAAAIIGYGKGPLDAAIGSKRSIIMPGFRCCSRLHPINSFQAQLAEALARAPQGLLALALPQAGLRFWAL